eukprot:2551621-Heterocapsa_arctica.AAC.1
MPSVKKKDWGKLDDHRFIHALDDEEHYDGDVVLGVDVTNKSRKVMIMVEGSIAAGASNSVAPIEAAPNVQVRESAGRDGASTMCRPVTSASRTLASRSLGSRPMRARR